jgi:hypothetical protein
MDKDNDYQRGYKMAWGAMGAIYEAVEWAAVIFGIIWVVFYVVANPQAASEFALKALAAAFKWLPHHPAVALAAGDFAVISLFVACIVAWHILAGHRYLSGVHDHSKQPPASGKPPPVEDDAVT